MLIVSFTGPYTHRCLHQKVVKVALLFFMKTDTIFCISYLQN